MSDLSREQDNFLEERLKLSEAPKFEIENFCFKEQLDFIRDPEPFKVAVCSRRAGKTIACAAHLIETAISNKDTVSLYITLSRNNAKKLIWREIKKINTAFNLGGVPDNTELSMTFPEKDSVIYLSGAKDSSEIEKFRGLPMKLAYVDECQSFRSYIQDLVDDVIAPALMDHAGHLSLIGTPGAVPVGYFHDAYTKQNGWAKHHWTFWNNPHIASKSGKTHKEILERELKRRNVSIDDPSIQREWFGKWVNDIDALVFHYSEALNHYESVPVHSNKWMTVLSIDLGFEDADALAVLKWHEHHPEVYLVEEKITRKQGLTELVDQIQKLIKEHKPFKILMDTGGLGKKIAGEITRRYQIPIEAAEKSRKFEFIELLNDAMRTGRFKAKKDSAFSEDCMKVEWDRDKSNGDKKVISDTYHSDICDAVLYAYREALHWLSVPEENKPEPNSREYFDRVADELEEAEEKRFEESQNPFAIGDSLELNDF